MKILIFSDSHGDLDAMRAITRKNRRADAIIFCGDGVRDFNQLRGLFPDKEYFGVTGNCDWYSDYPAYDEIELCGLRIFLTHGHMFGVKNGISRIVDMGRNNGFNIIIFGHTHQQLTTVEGGMMIINPGSVGYHNEYVILDINEDTGEVAATEYPRSDIPPLKMRFSD